MGLLEIHGFVGDPWVCWRIMGLLEIHGKSNDFPLRFELAAFGRGHGAKERFGGMNKGI